MPTFSAKSKERLLTCHPDLQRLMNEVIKHVDIAVVCGHRSMEDQDKAVRGGFSRVNWPNSKHNKSPSLAVDICPWPSMWKSEVAFIALAGVVHECAARLGIKVVWGGSWKSFPDMPHWELAG